MKEFLYEIILLIFNCVWKLIYNVLIQLTNLFYQQYKCVQNDIILITGAARGIGWEIANEFAKFKPKCIILWDLNGLKELEDLAAQFNSRNIPCEFQLCDVSDFLSVYKCAKEIILKHGGIDILVNNAGVTSGLPVLDPKFKNILENKEKNYESIDKGSNSNNLNCDSQNGALDDNKIDCLNDGLPLKNPIFTDPTSLNDYNNEYNTLELKWMNKIGRTISVNLLSHFWTLHCFLPSMAQKNYGHIVSVNSVLGLMPLEDAEDYCASKFGAYGLSQCLKLKLVNSGLKQTVVHPYMVNTEMFEGVEPRFPWIFTPMDKKVVGRKIVEAVLTNQQTLFLPWTMRVFYYLKIFLPDDILALIFRFLWLDKAISRLKKKN